MTISTWNPDAPADTAPVGGGADEIRTIKLDVQTVFPALTTVIINEDGDPPTSTDFSQLFTDVSNLLNIPSEVGIPVGMIAMWSGVASSVPAGWTICDGVNVNNIEVPDLTDRFIRGASASPAGGEVAVGASGGSYDTGTGGDVQATVEIDPHDITPANLPQHWHTTFVGAENAAVGANYVAAGEAAARQGSATQENNQPYAIGPAPTDPATIEPDVGRTGLGDGLSPTPAQLTHSTGTATIPGHTHELIPSYFALFYIMFVGT